MDEIPITYEELSDHNSKPVAKINGISLTPVEHVLAKKINELINNRQ